MRLLETPGYGITHQTEWNAFCILNSVFSVATSETSRERSEPIAT